MAFVTRYKTTVNNWDGDTITAEIQEDGFAGTLEEFTPIANNPISIRHETNVNLKEAGIIPSMATIQVYTNTDWDLNELLYATDRQFKVIIKNGSDEIFVGWVIAGINSEEYYSGDYVVSINATDGLSDLKDTPFLNSGILYDTLDRTSRVLYDIFNKTGLGLDWYENNDIYGASMSSGANASALFQSYINRKAYGQKITDVLSCWDVLQALAQAFYCRVFQDNHGTSSASWIFSKIDVIGDTTTYRKFSGTIPAGVLSNASYAPLLTMGTDIDHVNGRAQIAIKQAYKEITQTALRGSGYNLLKGENFEDDDFPTASTLNDWGNISNTKLVSTWGNNAFAKETVGNDTVLSMATYTRDHDSPNIGDYSISDGGGTERVRIQDTGTPITTSDWIFIPSGDYKGVWKCTATSTDYFDIDALYIEDQYVKWVTINNTTGVEYSTRLANHSGNIVDNTPDQYVSVDIDWYLQDEVNLPTQGFIVVVMARKSSTDYKTINSDGEWVDYDANQIHPIIVPLEGEDSGSKTLSVKASLSSNNNFYTSGTPYLYVGLFTTWGSTADLVKYNNVKVSVLEGSDKKQTTTIDTDNTEILETTFFHTDGDGDDNDEFRYNHPFHDDGANNNFENSWQQDGGTADNLEDIILANLAATYDKNSQIWTGSLEGDMSIHNAVKDPLNFDRIFQIQRISRNLAKNISQVSMIEIDPAGAPVFSLSISASTTVEFAKGGNNTTKQYATITNTGNAQVSLSATVTGDDVSYFSILNATEFTIDVGKTHLIEIGTNQESSGIYVSSIVVAETRANKTMTSKTIKLGHISTDSLIDLTMGVDNAAISAALGGATVIQNNVNGTPFPASFNVESLFNTEYSWLVIVSGGSGSDSYFLKYGSTTLDSDTISLPSDTSSSVSTSLYANAQSGWDGENLLFTL